MLLASLLLRNWVFGCGLGALCDAFFVFGAELAEVWALKSMREWGVIFGNEWDVCVDLVAMARNCDACEACRTLCA